MFSNLPKLEFDTKRDHIKICPCGKSNKDGKFCPYKGFEDKGHCFSCSKTFLPDLPKREFVKNSFKKSAPKFVPELKPASFIPSDLLRQSLKAYNRNNFVMFLIWLVGRDATMIAIRKYLIGTSKYWPNSTIFWQVGKDGVRSGKIIQYQIIPSEASYIGKDCKRNKNNKPPVRWVHKDPQFKDFILNQALFGQHLLDSDLSKPVAIVESEKTAVIASIYLPQFLWIAAGSLTNLNMKRCQVLKGRNITLFPDLNGFDLWTEKADELSTIARITVSDLLEKRGSSTDRQSGLDLADYLIRFDYKQFVKTETQVAEQKKTLPTEPLTNPVKGISKAATPLLKTSTNLSPTADKNTIRKTYRTFNFKNRFGEELEKLSSWNAELKELQDFFETIDLPVGPIKLDSGSTITNVQKLISSHLKTLEFYDGNKNFEPFLERLRFLKKMFGGL